MTMVRINRTICAMLAVVFAGTWLLATRPAMPGTLEREFQVEGYAPADLDLRIAR